MKTLRARATGYKPDGTLPLINIVLLLVLAFMMAGTFAEPLPPEFDPLLSETAELKEDVQHPVILTMNADGRLLQDGRSLNQGQLDMLLDRLRQSGSTLEVRADARSPAVQVIGLLRLAEDAGIKDVRIVTLGRK